jgi:hypothetical protein
MAYLLEQVPRVEFFSYLDSLHTLNGLFIQLATELGIFFEALRAFLLESFGIPGLIGLVTAKGDMNNVLLGEEG